jgi:phenylacetate-CoA ligase
MILDKKHECMPHEELQALQLKRLKAVTKKVYEKVPFYRARFDAAKLAPGDIRTLRDLHKLPFTSKLDLRDCYPLGLLAVPQGEVREIHGSSGTTGKPIIVAYTQKDLDIWSDVMARTLASAGCEPGDVIQNAYGYGLFTGGLGAHYGGLRLGAMVIPMSGGNSKRQIMLIQDLGARAIGCTPSYFLSLIETAEEMNVRFQDTSLRIGVFGAEPWTENLRREIEKRSGLVAIDIYGLSEIIGPGVSAECPEQNGLHINEDHFLAEIINSETGEVLPEGSAGELVITTLTKDATPVLRFRTRDICSITREKCPCGRTTARMSRITGRTDDMLIIRGVNVFPSQIESVLMTIEGAEPHYQIVVRREGALDDLEVQVEVNEKVFSDEIRGLETLSAKISDELHSVVGLRVKVKLVEPKTIERSMGKAKRVIDLRGQ